MRRRGFIASAVAAVAGLLWPWAKRSPAEDDLRPEYDLTKLVRRKRAGEHYYVRYGSIMPTDAIILPRDAKEGLLVEDLHATLSTRGDGRRELSVTVRLVIGPRAAVQALFERYGNVTGKRLPLVVRGDKDDNAYLVLLNPVITEVRQSAEAEGMCVLDRVTLIGTGVLCFDATTTEFSARHHAFAPAG